MVRIPASWRGSIAARPAGSGRQRGISARRIPVDSMQSYTRTVTVDLGNDGVAPQATFNGAGNAWALCGPYGTGQSWTLDQCYLSTSVGQLDVAEATLYIGPYMFPFQPVQSYLFTANLVANTQFPLGGAYLDTGWYVTAFWSGGTAGALAQLRVTGTKTALSQ